MEPSFCSKYSQIYSQTSFSYGVTVCHQGYNKGRGRAPSHDRHYPGAGRQATIQGLGSLSTRAEGDEAFEKVRKEDRAMGMEEALEYALEDVSEG